ncbi:uncharacterized protein LOC125045295 [Penaeus chinensis]|uniref:uncharacterized protein LOC125045295 n=1 Tax=Penaeus chinensis TaxID=139456 RepID=UPI001FB5EF68|nr:uncharacterized protein LOC125045295 [Penaeus chinensis]
MPFGLATAPYTLQRAVNAVLHPVLGRHTLAFLDDVVVASGSFEEHMDHLDKPMGLLAKAGFGLNLKKCKFAVNTLKFLGHLITPNGVLLDPDKVKKVAFPIIDIEALVVVEAVRTFDPYLYGRHFKIITDHCPLVHTVVATQQEDPLWNEVRDYLQERRMPRQRIPQNLEEFELRADLLYHLRVLPGRVISQLVIPRTLRTRALDAIHADAAAAHQESSEPTVA